MREHFPTSAKEIKRERLIEIFDLAHIKIMLEFEESISEKELSFLSKILDSKSIPTPKLIIKDHKKENENGDYPSRIIVPANNFTSAIPILGYLGIKKNDSEKRDYEAKTITQASDLKTKLEISNLKKKDVTIAKLDIVAMCLSIKFLLVKKAVRYYAKDLSEEDKSKIKCFLQMIRFGMKNIRVTFINKYCKYEGDINGENKGLTIGGFESVWLADLVASYILKQTKDIFSNFIYYGIYRDNGFFILKGIKTKREVNDWLLSFQTIVDKMAESNCL